MVVTPAVGRVGWIRAAARPAAAAAPPRLCNPRLCCALLCALLQCNSAAPFPVVLLCAHGPLGKPAGSLGKVWSKSPGARRASRCCCSAARTAAPHHTLPRSSKRASAPGSVSGSRGSPRTAEHFTARTFSYSSAHFVQVCARGSLPFRLGKTCLCFQHDAGKPQLLMWFRKYVSDEFSGFW